MTYDPYFAMPRHMRGRPTQQQKRMEFSMVKHADDCDWHLDQYDFECTCGAIKPKESA